DYSFTPAHPAGTLREYKSPGGGSPELRRQLGILKEFMDGFEFVRMRPRNDLVRGGQVAAELGGSGGEARTARASVRVLAEEGRAYAVYVLGGTRAELALELPAGTYRAEWLNTRTGRIDKAEDFTHQGGARSLASPPYTQDIALRVRSAK
ncbi:MAG: hypothetical protein HRF43_18235, partial [Phycisphaerae bacterium]